MATLKAGPGIPARIVYTAAVTLPQALVFASVVAGWDGLVECNWELEHGPGLRARDCRSCSARQRPISCPGSPLDSQAARCSLQSPVRAGPSHCATVKQRSVTSPAPRSDHSLVHGRRSARLSSCIQLSGQRPARRLTAARPCPVTSPGPSHGATVEQRPVTCHKPHCVRSITVLTFLSRHQYDAAASGEKSLSWPPSV
jgi:hypothetical protein